MSGYVNPFAGDTGLVSGRVDQGVDYSAPAGTPIKAIGRARIAGIIPNWYRGQPLLYYQLLDGPQKGRYIYTAEQIQPAVRVGQVVNAGETIAHVARTGTGLELGFATATGRTLAQATTGYTEGAQTPAGAAFSQFMEGIGAPGARGLTIAGKFTPQQLAAGKIASEGGSDAASGGVADPLGPSKLALEAAKAVVQLLVAAFGATFVKAALYVVMAGGGVALLIMGLSRTTGLHPARAARKAAEIGAAA